MFESLHDFDPQAFGTPSEPFQADQAGIGDDGWNGDSLGLEPYGVPAPTPSAADGMDIPAEVGPPDHSEFAGPAESGATAEHSDLAPRLGYAGRTLPCGHVVGCTETE